MQLYVLFVTAVALAMDAFAVSVSSGIQIPDTKVRHGVKIGLFFGFFQFLMPVIGWAAGQTFAKYIDMYDHYIAFILLAFIGAKMVKEAFSSDDGCETDSRNPLDTKVLFLLAIATSIDALAVGISFALMNVNIRTSSVLIGIVTFFICFLGVMIGKKIGCLFRKKAEIAGGIVLIMIGLKILIEGIAG